MEDLLVFDDAALQGLLCHAGFGLTVEDLAHSLHGISRQVIRRIERNVSASNRAVEQSVCANRSGKCATFSASWDVMPAPPCLGATVMK